MQDLNTTLSLPGNPARTQPLFHTLVCNHPTPVFFPFSLSFFSLSPSPPARMVSNSPRV